MLMKWKNGEKGDIVRAVIDHNFKILGRYLPNHLLALKEKERDALTSDYLTDGLIVYDIDNDTWLKYTNGVWVSHIFGTGVYVREIEEDEWENGEIHIGSSEHGKIYPIVQLFYQHDSGVYEEVVGGVLIKGTDNVILKSDLPFKGKVVIR